MLGKKISVRKLFLLLLAAILALLLLFFLHGPFLEPGVEDAVSQAVLAQVEEAADPDLVAAEGHKIFQATEEGEELVVYGVFCYGLYQVGEDQRGQRVSGSDAVPAKLTFRKEGDGSWTLQRYEEAGSKELRSELFPLSLRPFLLFMSWYDRDLEEQVTEYLIP